MFGVRKTECSLSLASEGLGVQSSWVPLDWTDFAGARLELVCFEAVAVCGVALNRLVLGGTDLTWWLMEWKPFAVDLPPFS